jgi:hypothetical protein
MTEANQRSSRGNYGRKVEGTRHQSLDWDSVAQKRCQIGLIDMYISHNLGYFLSKKKRTIRDMQICPIMEG